MAAPTKREPLATSREVADYLGYSIGTLRNWRSQGRGPRFIGRKDGVRYRWRDVEAWLDQKTTRTAS